jgi:endonuclease/exonuclease/phosphatase family metal-dependent hydrolase
MRRYVIACVAVLAWLLARCDGCDGCDDAPTRHRIATFNIENFPKHARQVTAAFDELVRLDAGILAVQEITDPVLFATTARRRLGEPWSFVHIDTTSGRREHRPHHLGVAWDRRRYRFVQLRIHDGTRLGGGYKPTLDVELRARGGETLRVLVVHFKAGGENHPVRRRQYVALAKIVADVERSGAHVIVLGDFNATGPADRTDLARLARATRLTWATEHLACSSFWDRDDGCPRSTLDHALSTRRPTGVHAAGACATEGCDWQASCPLWIEEVSDHCPVVLAFED